MKLKRIEIQGFKSFPGKTSIEFCDGITSVVGPNGSGKSNILEAIRWVMGEQRTKILRCKKMEDVIFNGSESLKPVGMAEVRLTLSSDGKSFPPPMSDYVEVMVTRRLFREGDSQYEFNGVPCRLTDIMEFFLDTGVGRNSYSIIEQGRVEQIIAAKPEERRVFLEEAASVNKYKARRESTIKKLEQTNHNLQRIKDVIAEVSKQSHSLRRQSVKAQRCRDLKNRLKGLEIAYEAVKSRNLMMRLEQAQTKQKELENLLINDETQLATLAAKSESVRLEMAETQRAFGSANENLRSSESELVSVKSRLEICASQERQLAERKSINSRELEALLAKKKDAESRITVILSKLEELDLEELGLSEETESCSMSVSDLQKEFSQQTVSIEKLKNSFFETLRTLAQQRNLLDQNLKRKAEILVRLEKDQGDVSLLTRSLKELVKTREKALLRNLQIQETLVKLEDDFLADHKNRSALLAKLATVKENSRNKEKQFLTTRARIESLSEQRRNYESYGIGTQYAMKALSPRPDEKLPRPLGEIIDCSPKYYRAVTAVLENQLGAIMVKDFAEAMNIAQKLKELESGRITLLALKPLEPEILTENTENTSGFTKLSDCVIGTEGFSALIREMIRDFNVVQDFNEALDLAMRAEVSTNLVTLDGEIISNRRYISLGTPETPEKDVLFKKNELESLLKESSEFEQELSEHNSEIAKLENEVKDLSTVVEDRKRQEADLKIEQARILKDIEKIGSDISRNEGRIREIELNSKRILAEIENLEGNELLLRDSIRTLDENKEAIEKEEVSFKATIEKTSSLLSSKTSTLNDLKIRIAQIEERKKSQETDLKRTRGFLRNTEHEILDLNQEALSVANRIQIIYQENKELLDRDKILSDRRNHFQVTQGKLQNLFDSLKPVAERITQEEFSLNKEIENLRESTHLNQVEMVRMEENLRNCVEKIHEKYGIDIRFEKSPATQPEEAEIEAIKSKISSIGEVNLSAITESQQVDDRLNFLVTQEKDLKGAVKSLFSTIEKIDVTTKQMFRTTFQEVNSRFQEIFASLFNGGEAKLELTGLEDSIDQGVNILVKPPGKRLQHVELLSGGEKALTAIAFIFAIFLYKPSSFCLLDEVDAPLDDSNVDRFNQMLRDLAKNTQFVVITHNKKSMEGADCLFGVTSEETGASTLVSVKFAQQRSSSIT